MAKAQKVRTTKASDLQAGGVVRGGVATQPKSTRWSEEEWAELERAAALVSRGSPVPVLPSGIIRHGAIRLARSLLAGRGLEAPIP